MHPDPHLGELIVNKVAELREHFDCVSVTASVYDDEQNQTYRYVYHKGHIGGVIEDMREHLELMRDLDAGGPPAHEPEYLEEEND